MSFPGLARFYSDAAAGKLPQISIIIGPTELSEHPPYQPRDGGWLQAKVGIVHMTYALSDLTVS